MNFVSPLTASPNFLPTGRSLRREAGQRAFAMVVVLMVAEKPSLALVAPYIARASPGLGLGLPTTSASSLSPPLAGGCRAPLRWVTHDAPWRRHRRARVYWHLSRRPGVLPRHLGQGARVQPRLHSRVVCDASLLASRVGGLPSCTYSPLLSERPALATSVLLPPSRLTACYPFAVCREASDVDPQLLFGAETAKVPVCTHVCVSVCVCMCVYVCVCMCVSVCICMHVSRPPSGR